MRRLIRTLNALYDSPPIACHHDFGQSSLSIEGLGPHVHLVDAFVEIKLAYANRALLPAKVKAFIDYTAAYCDHDGRIVPAAA